MACHAGERQYVLAEPAQDLVEALRRFGWRLVQAPLHLGPVGAPDHGPIRDGREPVYQHVHRLVAKPPHRFRVETERVVHFAPFDRVSIPACRAFRLFLLTG